MHSLRSPAELKLEILRIYNKRLDERAEKKKFVLDRDLLFPKEKKKNKEEKALYNQFKPFARFLSQEEFEKFITVR